MGRQARRIYHPFWDGILGEPGEVEEVSLSSYDPLIVARDDRCRVQVYRDHARSTHPFTIDVILDRPFLKECDVKIAEVRMRARTLEEAKEAGTAVLQWAREANAMLTGKDECRDD